MPEDSERGRRVALVTGAGTGIGRAAAVALLGDGYRVALVGRRRELLELTAREAGEQHALVLSADVTEADAVESVFQEVRDRWGRLDVLFNNAGRGAPALPFEEVPLEAWRAVVDLNLTAMFVCMQQAIKIMKSQDPRGGRIINNGSIAAHTPRPQSAPYAATKHAVTGLTKSAALEGREHNIACSQIDIGNAATPMTGEVAAGMLQPSGAVVVEPLIDVEHVGRAILYMANLPLDTNVPFMTLMATKMPFAGRG